MKTHLFIAVLIICSVGAKAQTKTGMAAGQKDSSNAPVPPPTYMMPDGTFISKDKTDSVRKAWNGALFIGHMEKDKAQGILHLVRLNEDNLKQIAEKNAKDAQIVKSMVHKPAPNFDLTAMNGTKWSLTALRGKVVVLNFWFTACPPCLDEMPQLNEITKMYSPDKVVFLALTFNDAGMVQAFLQTHEFKYTILPASKSVDQRYKVSGWPTSFVINKKGMITYGTNISPNIKHDLSSAINEDL